MLEFLVVMRMGLILVKFLLFKHLKVPGHAECPDVMLNVCPAADVYAIKRAHPYCKGC